MKKILIINGPNINMLGKREKDVYGQMSLEEVNWKIKKWADQSKCTVEFFQSNSEGKIIDEIHKALSISVDYIIINPGAYSHYSYAIRDALKGVNIPTIEVHFSNIHGREDFRKESVVAPVCIGQISGLGYYSYILALDYFLEAENGGYNV